MLNMKIVINSPFFEVNNGWIYRYINLIKGLSNYFSLSVFSPGSVKNLKQQLSGATVYGFSDDQPQTQKFTITRWIRSYINPRNQKIFLPGFKYYPGYESYILKNGSSVDISLYFGLDALIYYGQKDTAPLIFCDFCDSMARHIHNQIRQNHRNPVLGYVDLAYLKRIKRTMVSPKVKIIAITSSDASFIKKTLPQNSIITIPNGIRVTAKKIDILSKYKSDSIVFVGSLNYAPNIDSVTFIIKQVWPEISSSFKKLKLLLVGRNPDPQVIDLCSQDTRILLHANVQDVFPFIEMSKLFLCPMFLGGGLKNKIMEALVSYTPILTNTEGATGIPIINKKHGWIADTKEDMVEGIKQILTMDYEKYESMAQDCFELASKFSWDSVCTMFKDIINSHCHDQKKIKLI